VAPAVAAAVKGAAVGNAVPPVDAAAPLTSDTSPSGVSPVGADG
jgi:hypothetical protein